jgi:hypothetical protein
MRSLFLLFDTAQPKRVAARSAATLFGFLIMGDLGFEPRTSGLRVRCATTAPVTLSLLILFKSDLYTSKCLHKYVTKFAIKSCNWQVFVIMTVDF